MPESIPSNSDEDHGRILGILAGGGQLPAQVAAAARAAGRKVFVVGAGRVRRPGRAGATGRTRSSAWAPRAASWPRCAGHGCQDLVLIGPVRRPSVLDMRPDAEGARILARIGRAAFAGDDGLLAAVIRVLGEEGFRVIGAQDVLREALAPAGLLTRDRAGRAGAGGYRAGRGGGPRAGCGRCRAGLRGAAGPRAGGRGGGGHRRDAGALRRTAGAAGPRRRAGQAGQAGAGAPRRPADDRARTRCAAAAAAGLRGVAFEAGGTILADRAAAVAAADAAGLFLLGLDPETICQRGVGT